MVRGGPAHAAVAQPARAQGGAGRGASAPVVPAARGILLHDTLSSAAGSGGALQLYMTTGCPGFVLFQIIHVRFIVCGALSWSDMKFRAYPSDNVMGRTASFFSNHLPGA